jgi:hypothetical protein
VTPPGRHLTAGRRRRARQVRALGVLVAVVGLVVTVAVGLAGGLGGGAGRRPASTGRGPGTPVRKQAKASATGTSVGPYGVTAAWVINENKKQGTGAWHLTRPATGGQIAGYSNTVSINEGGAVNLYVSTTSATYSVIAYRMGWYGGAEGRQIWVSGTVPGRAQPTCPVLAPTNTVECHWTDPLHVQTTVAGWPQGDYLFKLTAASGYQSYIPLTIRNDASHSAYLIQNDVTTWQAYNLYGGYDLYQGPATPGSSTLHNRSRIVSFDRPYASNYGASDFIGLELKLVALAESRGLDVSYTTDVNVNERPSLLLNHRTFISLGHDEYWSRTQRNAAVAARAHGVNLFFMGANAIYRPIRFESSPLGPDRLEVDYKNALEDPLYGKNNSLVTPWAWRDPPLNDPESKILGEEWQCNPVRANMVVTDPTAWIWGGLHLAAGTQLPNVVGPEYDHYSPNQPSPPNVQIVAASPVTCNGVPHQADFTYYTWHGSGAGVIDTGTIDWVGFLAPVCDRTCPEVNRVVTDATLNILRAFGEAPAGRKYPSVSNYASIPHVP